MTASRLIVYVNRIESAAAALTDDEVERAVRVVADAEGLGRGEISITFLDARTMADLHETHLARAGLTDVLSFNLGPTDDPLGDIYVCPEVAAMSAAELGIELREELLRLVVHGTLHLFGHEHPEGPSREDSPMFRLQEALLAKIL